MSQVFHVPTRFFNRPGHSLCLSTRVIARNAEDPLPVSHGSTVFTDKGLSVTRPLCSFNDSNHDTQVIPIYVICILIYVIIYSGIN